MNAHDDENRESEPVDQEPDTASQAAETRIGYLWRQR